MAWFIKRNYVDINGFGGFIDESIPCIDGVSFLSTKTGEISTNLKNRYEPTFPSRS
ncbi:hypothetical protein [Sutcliffiella rhizosphaerae]|uniref:hypothetical protein n=1 Tax=Sutcliffiella rhizosphaerae TaxID=2880967 RepID=UPI001E2BE7D0|nr:hypothetical protein [Sutcliffiella rhizosphaerae]